MEASLCSICMQKNNSAYYIAKITDYIKHIMHVLGRVRLINANMVKT